jgi:hypothetical protein
VKGWILSDPFGTKGTQGVLEHNTRREEGAIAEEGRKKEKKKKKDAVFLSCRLGWVREGVC